MPNFKYSIGLDSNATEKQLKQLLSALQGLGTISSFELEEQQTSKNINVQSPTLSPPVNPNVKVFQLTEVIKKIYDKYPRKQGKAKGLEKLTAYLKKGCEVTGMGKIKLNHHQIYIAVQQYAIECEELHKEQQFIKEFSTFVNKPIIDYVEATKDIYEKGMQSTYGSDWGELKFEYK